MLRAVARLGPYLSVYDYCSSGKHDDDAETLETLSKVIAIAKNAGKFDEKVLFRGENANVRHLLLASKFWLSDRFLFTGIERGIQDTFSQRYTHHGLRRLRQVPSLGKSADHWRGHGPENSIRT